MGKNSKTTDFLKECMADALICLMQEKPLDKISAAEITERAGVGRATWFRHFSSKEEAVTFKLLRLWEHWAEAHNLRDRERYGVDNAIYFFRFNYEIRELHVLIYQVGLRSAIYDAYYGILMPVLDSSGEDPRARYEGKFFSYGLFGLLDEWIKNGFRETPRELSHLYRRAITGSLRSMSEKKRKKDGDEGGHA